MFKPVPWFSRTFDCAADPSRCRGSLERLAGTPARLEEKIAAADPSLWTQKPDGQWSIQEQAGHLLDLEWLWFARIEDFKNGAEVLTPADLQNRKTHEANHNARAMSDLLADFRRERKKAADAVSTLGEAALEHAALHPRLRKPMRFADFAFFVAEHDDHHLAVISWLARF